MGMDDPGRWGAEVPFSVPPPASRPPCTHGFEDKAFDDESTTKAESNVAKDPAKTADPKMTFRDRGVEKRTNNTFTGRNWIFQCYEVTEVHSNR